MMLGGIEDSEDPKSTAEEGIDLGQEDYVIVRQEDIVDGIACFTAAYVMSLKQTKDLTPNQHQEGPFNFKAGKPQGSLDKLHLNPYSWPKVEDCISSNFPKILCKISSSMNVLCISVFQHYILGISCWCWIFLLRKYN